MPSVSTKTKNTYEEPRPIRAEDVDLHDIDELVQSGSVDRAKTYRAWIQLGARRKWRNFNSGQWVVAAEDSTKRTKDVFHKAQVMETPPIMGRTLLGLLSGHNKWVLDNKSSEPLMGTNSLETQPGQPVIKQAVQSEVPPVRGDVSNQLLVISWDETQEAPTDANTQSPQEMIGEIVKAAVAASTEAVMKELRPSQSKASK